MSELILLKVSFDVWCFMSGKTRIGPLATYTLPASGDGMLWRVIVESRLWLKLSLKRSILVLCRRSSFY